MGNAAMRIRFKTISFFISYEKRDSIKLPLGVYFPLAAHISCYHHGLIITQNKSMYL